MDNKLQQNGTKFVDRRRLAPVEVQDMPPWVRHFLIFVVKQCAAVTLAWCEQMQEAVKELDSNGHSR